VPHQFCRNIQGWVRTPAKLTTGSAVADGEPKPASAKGGRCAESCARYAHGLALPQGREVSQTIMGGAEALLPASPPARSAHEHQASAACVVGHMRRVVQGTRSDKGLENHSVIGAACLKPLAGKAKTSKIFSGAAHKNTAQAQAALYRQPLRSRPARRSVVERCAGK